MNILCIAQVTNRNRLDNEILIQKVNPDRTIFLIDNNPEKTINTRRKRIAENHRKLRDIVKAYKPDAIWQLEDDSILETDTLKKLIKTYNKYDKLDPNFGYVSGVQIGRHGLYHVGAWKNFTKESFESIDHSALGIQRVEATGFYCLLAKTEAWLSGNCYWYDNVWGPDVNWGLTMPYNKYIDMDIKIGHKTKRGEIWPQHASTCTVYFKKDSNGKWNYKTRN